MRNLSKMFIDEGQRRRLSQMSMLGMDVSNSTQIIADLKTAAAAVYSATALAAAQNANGPNMDIQGVINLCVLKAQEMAGILAYVLEGKQIQTSLTAPTGGVITSGADSTTYNTLVGVYQILK